MTAYTANTTGAWSSAATWGGGGTPSANGDTWVINSGVDVEMDADTSGLTTGLGAGTINGTLHFKRTVGTYYLKQNATITVSTTGTLDASDGSGGAYPANCTATILLNGNFSITVAGNGVVNLICGEPTHKYVKLTQVEAIAATTLHVDTDLTVGGDALWANPSLVRIDDINQAVESEERTISSVTSSTVVITAGLTAAKASGAYVILVTRNVKVLGISAASGTGISGGTGGVIKAEIRLLANGITLPNSAIIGGTVSNCTNGLNSGIGCACACVVSGCTQGYSGCVSLTINDLTSGCTNGLSSCSGIILIGNVSGCTNGINNCSNGYAAGAKISGCARGINVGGGRLSGVQLSSNTQDLMEVVALQAYNTLFGSSTEFASYNSAQRSLVAYVESIDHDQTAGAFRAWCRGGIVSSVSSPVFDASRPRSYNAVCESASAYAFMQRQVLVPAGGSVTVICYIRKDASMSYLPRLWVFSADKEPLLSGSADSEQIMTNSTDTWETLKAAVTNSTDAPKLYMVRMLAKNASGNVYFDPIIRTSAGVNRARLVNAA